MLVKLTVKSILSRKFTSILLIASIALSAFLLIGIQKIKYSAKVSFSSSISNTDLIVGPRSGDIQLLLYTVFRKGQAITNMSWQSLKSIQALKQVAWVVPVSLGDSHRNYPVLATTQDYFKYYKYGKKKSLVFKKGRPFKHYNHVVLGFEVAKKLKYSLNDIIYLSHGIGRAHLKTHRDSPFKVVGILKQTGTPVDKTVHISLQGMTAIHLSPAQRKLLQEKKTIKHESLTPSSVTSCLVGLKSKFHIFSVQKRITNELKEPLMAIIPGVSLARLWSTISTFDRVLFIVTILVTIITYLGLLLSLTMSLQQRQKELQVLRALGAHPSQLFMLLILESIVVCLGGVLAGIGLMSIGGVVLKPYLEEKWGLILSLNTVTLTELYLAGSIIVFGIIISAIPAYLAYYRVKKIV